jgi:hypothetical protein
MDDFSNSPLTVAASFEMNNRVNGSRDSGKHKRMINVSPGQQGKGGNLYKRVSRAFGVQRTHPR